MPHYSADSADDDVAAQAYAAASKLTNNTTILLALFETGLVESNFHNHLHATDHDSLGYLQQRPSQGWPDPTNIATATKSFINKAKRVLAEHPNYSAGQLAAEVQRPARQYRGRYQQASAAAQRLLAEASSGRLKASDTAGAASPGSGSTSVTITKNGSGGAADGQGQAPGPSDHGFGDGFGFGAVSDQIFKLFMPSNLIRAAALIAGAFFIFYGVVLLSREVRDK